jgi:hypothetical protein
MVQRIRARVQGGRLRLDEPYDAPDGTEVELAVIDDDDLTDEERARLHADIEASMAELDRGEGIPADQVIADLRTLIPR